MSDLNPKKKKTSSGLSGHITMSSSWPGHEARKAAAAKRAAIAAKRQAEQLASGISRAYRHSLRSPASNACSLCCLHLVLGVTSGTSSPQDAKNESGKDSDNKDDRMLQRDEKHYVFGDMTLRIAEGNYCDELGNKVWHAALAVIEFFVDENKRTPNFLANKRYYHTIYHPFTYIQHAYTFTAIYMLTFGWCWS
jgi:hypothetical protein